METHHYFDNSPEVESNPKSVAYTFNGYDYVFVTDKGVFSYEKVDRATRVLLDVFRENYTGKTPENIIDLGSGYGVITCIAANLFPEAQVIAVEPNERARVLTYINFINNCEGDRLKVFSPDECSNAIRADLILSNPPVRVGKEILHNILREWTARLNDKGEMWLVVAKNLGSDSLAGYIEYELNRKVQRIASKKGFRIFRC